MSRHARHGGRPHHRPHRHVESGPRPDRPVDRPSHPAPSTDGAPAVDPQAGDAGSSFDAVPASPPATLVAVATENVPDAHVAEPVTTDSTARPTGEAPGLFNGDAAPNGCTPAQMRRFIKSRPWIPMHELRRRFGINGHEDDVTGVFVGSGTVFVGLPEREGRMLGELLRGGDVGYELSVDPVTPIVIGVFPMRPVARS